MKNRNKINKNYLKLSKIVPRLVLLLLFTTLITSSSGSEAPSRTLAAFTAHFFTLGGALLGFSAGAETFRSLSSRFSESFLYTWKIRYILTVDWIISFAFVPIYILNFAFFDRFKRTCHQTTPILFVHGYLHNSSAWIYYLYRFKCAGFKNLYTINLGLPVYSIEHYAQLVDRKVKEIARQTGREDVILVGHSMGGIISSYFATKMAKPNTVKKVLTIAAPFTGSPKGDVGIGACAKQLKINSPFVLSVLDAVQQEKTVNFIHYSSIADQTIQPAQSAFVKGKINRVFDNLGHMMYLFSDRVVDAMITDLQD